ERAGATDLALFAEPALERVAALSHGIPRVINVLCAAALLTAFATGAKQVTPAVIDEAWRDYAPAIAPEAEPQAVVIVPAASMARVAEPPPQVAASVEPVFSVAAARAAAVESALAAPPVEVAPPPPAPETPPLEPPMTSSPVPASPVARHAFSIPAGAACVAALAVVLYAVSPPGKDADPPAAAAPSPAVASGTVSEAIAATAEVRPVRTESPLSTEEAAAVVEQFRTAYEARDVDRLVQLFAPAASRSSSGRRPRRLASWMPRPGRALSSRTRGPWRRSRTTSTPRNPSPTASAARTARRSTSGHAGTATSASGRRRSGCSRSGRPALTANVVRPLPRSTPTPTPPRWRFARPSERRVGSRTMASTGTPRNTSTRTSGTPR